MNPGLFTCITFPFLFAVMFGDIGHGIIMFLSAVLMISVERRYPKGFGNEIVDTFYYGRYIILLMGMFAVYTGFIYNDIFSLSLHWFKSGWAWPTSGTGPVAAVMTTNRYKFGIDPAWHGADNALIFTNSLKMKMSVIMGVIHVGLHLVSRPLY